MPTERRPAFDSAIDALAARRRVFHVSLEADGGDRCSPCANSEGADRDLALIEGHGRWVQPLRDASQPECA